MRSVDYCTVNPYANPQPTAKPPVGAPTRTTGGVKPKLDIVGNNGWPVNRFPLNVSKEAASDTRMKLTPYMIWHH